MKKTLIAVTVIASLALTGCGKKADTAANSPKASSTATATTAASGGFGSPLDLGGGISLTISTPKSFVPGKFASNYLKGQSANNFDVTVKNGGTANLDPSTILLSANSGTNTCSDVLDGDNGITGAPTDPVAAGTSITFKFAFACDAKSGDPFHLSVSVGAAEASIDGKVA